MNSTCKLIQKHDTKHMHGQIPKYQTDHVCTNAAIVNREKVHATSVCITYFKAIDLAVHTQRNTPGTTR
jgi:hypothetical protein